MSLKDKYAALVKAAITAGATNLQVREQYKVLYMDCEVATGAAKDKLWTIYDKIDPNFLSGDLVLNINVAKTAVAIQLRVVTKSSNLNIRQGPGTDQPLLGKAAHESIVTLVNKYNDAWFLVRTAEGIEGYASSEYLEG